MSHISDGYIGTYASIDSRGVYHFTFDEVTGELSQPKLFYEAKNAKWVSLYENSLAFPTEKGGAAGTSVLELEDGRVKSCLSVLNEQETPCCVLQDENVIYTANYHEGIVMVYRMNTGRLAAIGRIACGKGAGCHQVLLHDAYLMVPCLVQHKIRLFGRKAPFDPAGELCFPDGSGPRHGVFNQAHTKLYVVSEWSNELFTYQVQGGKFRLAQTVPILPEEGEFSGAGKKAAAAAVRLTRDERFVYISVRGEDVLAVLDVSGERIYTVQYMPCGGVHPRDFILSRDERFVLIANRFEGGIVSMKRDKESGRLLDICGRAAMPEGVSLVLKNK